MSVTKEAVFAALIEAYPADDNESEPNWSELSYNNFSAPYVRLANGDYGYDESRKPKFDGFSLNVVEDFGGEGLGDQRYLVIEATPEDGSERTYFRKEGYYASYDGDYWDGEFYAVKPREKTVTVYEKV